MAKRTSRKKRTLRRAVPAHVKAAADRAEARTKGASPDASSPAVPIDPPIVRAAEIVEEAKRRKVERKKGRPTDYTEEIAAAICDRLCEGEALRQVCEDEGMPDERSVRRWAADPDHPFSPLYARAREVGYWKMIDDCIEIADDGRNDWMDREFGGGRIERVVDKEAILRSKLRVDTRLHILAKRLPKVMGKAVDEQPSKDDASAFRLCWEAISSGYRPGDRPATIDRGRLIEAKAEPSED